MKVCPGTERPSHGEPENQECRKEDKIQNAEGKLEGNECPDSHFLVRILFVLLIETDHYGNVIRKRGKVVRA
jgi:hypothetical protein